MKNIGIYVEQNLEEKLKSFSEDNFFDMKKYKKNIEFDLIIIDIKTQNIDKKLSEYYSLNIPVILLIGIEDSINMRKYFVNRMIRDYVLRDDFV